MNKETKKIQDELGFIDEHAKNLLDYFAEIENNRKLTVSEDTVKQQITLVRNMVDNAMIYLDIETNGNPWES